MCMEYLVVPAQLCISSICPVLTPLIPSVRITEYKVRQLGSNIELLPLFLVAEEIIDKKEKGNTPGDGWVLPCPSHQLALHSVV